MFEQDAGSVDPTPAASDTVAEALTDFYQQQLDWEPCGGGFQCAEATVPMDYDDPDGEAIVLPLVRLPAGDPAARIGSLLVNPGGPGASGVDYARAAESIVTAAVRDAYDIVGFDPRGVAGSDPAVDCVDDAVLDDYLDSDPTPAQDEVDEAIKESGEFVEACTSRSGALLEYVGTDDVARDLDVLRGTLGDDHLYYLGKSYGTSIGAEYVRQFPERVGRLVLDGVIDPSLDRRSFALGQTTGLDRALTRFAQGCLSERCSVGTTEEEVRGAVETVLDRADENPIPTDQEGRDLTEGAAFEGIIMPLYLAPEQGYPLLENALASALMGDGSALLQMSDWYRDRDPDGSYNGNSNEVIGVVSCADRGGSGSVEAVAENQHLYLEASPTFGEAMSWSEIGCDSWPDSEQLAPGVVTGEGAAPVLVVGTTGDLATPYEWAESLADQLSSGMLLTYDSTPHTAYRLGSRCIDAAVDAYLLDGTLPEPDTVCQ